MWVIAIAGGCAQTAIAVPDPHLPLCRPVAASARDGARVASDNYRVLFENEDVRVLAVSVAPHSRGAAHIEMRSGVDYIDAAAAPTAVPTVTHFDPEGSHCLFNNGDTPFHAIRVELKHPGCFLRATRGPIEPDAPDAVVAAPLSHKVLYEDRDIRVLDVMLAAHAREPFHSHAWPGVAYVLALPATRYFTPDDPDPPLDTPPPNATPRVVPMPAAGRHAVQNESDFAGHAIRFEVKFAGPASAPRRSAVRIKGNDYSARMQPPGL
jgi:hypothetical protein